MAYDPQRDRRRPRPGDEPAPIEAILGAASATPVDPGSSDVDDSPRPYESVSDDPPPIPSVTPQPADPWSDRLLFGMSVSTIAGIVVALLVFRWLWLRGRRASSADEGQ